jgi:hypothetical protein
METLSEWERPEKCPHIDCKVLFSLNPQKWPRINIERHINSHDNAFNKSLTRSPGITNARSITTFFGK